MRDTVILVHGRGRGPRDLTESVRLSDRWSPPFLVLGRLLAATESGVTEQYGPTASARKLDGLAQVPAYAFAWYVISAGVGLAGPAAVLDKDGAGRDAVFVGAMHQGCWSGCGRAEDVYTLDLPTRTLSLYGGRMSHPVRHLARGPVDPVSLVGSLGTDFQAAEFARTVEAVKALTLAGWTVTPGKEKGKAKKALAELRKKMTAQTIQGVKSAIPAEHRTEAVAALVAAAEAANTFDNLAFLADALQDSGFHNPQMLKRLRTLAA